MIQDMFSKSNVVYKITKDLDLESGTLNIPENCVLDFQGGSITNGTVNFNNTTFQGSKFFTNCRFKGSVDKNYQINIKDFGVLPNTETDVTDVLNDLINISSCLYIPDGTYKIRAHDPDREDDADGYLTGGSGLMLHSNFTLNLGSTAVLEAITNSKQQYCIVSIVDSNNVRILGGTIKGDRDTHTGVLGEWGYGVYISGSTNVSMRDTICRDCWGDGVNVQISHISFKECENINFYNVICDNNRRQGMSLEGLKYGTFTSCSFINTNGKAPQTGVDLEPWDNKYIVEHVVFDGCTFNNNTNFGIWCAGIAGDQFNIRDIIITNCSFLNNGVNTQNGGIQVKDSNNIVIKGNIFQFNTGSWLKNIEIATGDNIFIQDNILINGGINLIYGGKVTIKNNYITTEYDVNTDIFWMTGIGDLLVDGNVIDLEEFHKDKAVFSCYSEQYHSNWVIRNNTINTGSYALYSSHYNENNKLFFINNIIKNTRKQAIFTTNSNNIIVANNYFYGCAWQSKGELVWISGHTYDFIDNTVISIHNGEKYTAGLFIGGDTTIDSLTIVNNKVDTSLDTGLETRIQTNLILSSFPQNPRVNTIDQAPTTKFSGYWTFLKSKGMPVWWDGEKYVDANSEIIAEKSGTFAQKPTDVKVGYAYFCTDKSTTEGSTNGIMIYHKGSNVWVDALGRRIN